MKELILSFEPGTLKVYKIMTFLPPQDPAEHIQAVAQYAWLDEKSPEGFGPFTSVEECLHHYTYIKELNRSGIGMDNNVINVDFVRRKKV